MLLCPTGSLTFIVFSEAVLLTALPDARTTGRTDPAVFGLEQASIMGMRALLTQAVEALSFILLLMDYKFSDVMQAYVSWHHSFTQCAFD